MKQCDLFVSLTSHNNVTVYKTGTTAALVSMRLARIHRNSPGEKRVGYGGSKQYCKVQSSCVQQKIKLVGFS